MGFGQGGLIIIYKTKVLLLSHYVSELQSILVRLSYGVEIVNLMYR